MSMNLKCVLADIIKRCVFLFASYERYLTLCKQKTNRNWHKITYNTIVCECFDTPGQMMRFVENKNTLFITEHTFNRHFVTL